jgi:hypothetical protein
MSGNARLNSHSKIALVIASFSMKGLNEEISEAGKFRSFKKVSA